MTRDEFKADLEKRISEALRTTKVPYASIDSVRNLVQNVLNGNPEDYHSSTCITAGELREMRCDVPGDIPDCAWVPRSALKFNVQAPTAVNERRFVVNVRVEIAQPFRWIEVKGTLEVL